MADNQSWCSSGNDLSDNLESNVKLFVDDASIFSVVCDPINTLLKLNIDLDKVKSLGQ